MPAAAKKAPKAKAADTSAGKKPSAKAKAKAAAVPTTALEATDADVLVRTCSRDPLDKARIEREILKVLRDTYKGFSHTQKCSLLVDGVSLFTRLCNDRFANVTMGKLYHSARRNEYDDLVSPHKRLKVSHPNEPEDPRVKQMIDALESHPPNLKPLTLILDLDEIMNNKNSVAVLKGLLKVKPQSGHMHTNIVMEGMRWVKRTQCDQRFPSEVALMKDHFDLALLYHLKMQRGEGMLAKNWWPLVSDVAFFM